MQKEEMNNFQQKYNPVKFFLESVDNKFAFSMIFVCAFVASIVTGLGYILIGELVDTFNDLDMETATYATVLPILLLFVGREILSHVVYRLVHLSELFVTPNMATNMRKRLSQDALERDPSFFTNELGGSIADRIDAVPRAYFQIQIYLQWDVVNRGAFLLFTLGLCFWHHIYLGLVVIGWFLAIMLYVYLYMKHKHIPTVYDYTKKRSMFAGRAMDMISNAFGIIMQGDQKRMLSGLTPSIDVVEKAFRKERASMMIYQLGKGVVETFFLSVIILSGAWFVFENILTPGAYVAVLVLTIRAGGQIWDLSLATSGALREMATVKEGLDFLGKYPKQLEKTNREITLTEKPEIVFDDVSFNYEGHAAQVLDQLNIAVRPGEKVGLIGHSGAGKTTLINMVLGFYDATKGVLSIGGENVETFSKESRRQHISVIPQDITLFHQSIMDNIRFSQPDATDDEVMEAAKKAYAHEFIEALPEGYNSVVGDRGVKLSGGQRQRVAIARAFLRKAPILILDEATSALDSQSEQYIQESLVSLMADKTAIVVAHRLSTIAHLDRLIVLDKGRVVEDGSHSELIEKDGLYASLWKMQSSGFLGE